ncbi:hypothetical protein ACKWTF_007610 [Chironomus riparius]
MSELEMDVDQNPNPFNRKNKGKLERTPPTNIIKSPHDPSNESVQVGVKRHSDELLSTNSNMFDKLMNRFNALSNDLKSMETKVEKKLDEKFDGLQSFIDRTEKTMGEIEVKVIAHDIQIDQNTKAINYLNQKELKNKIDIMGVKWPETIERDKIKEEVMKVMRKYNIDLDVSMVKTAYLRNVKSLNLKVGVIEFHDFETKLRVMREKRQSKIKDGVYFDHSLTPLNGKLMGSTRKVAKEKNFKTYISNNKICIKKSKDDSKWIESEDDLELVKRWDPNSDPKAQKGDSQHATSSAVTSQNSSA